MRQQWFWLFFAGMSALLGTVANQVQAQQAIIKVAVPVFWQQLVRDDLFADFEAAHNVQVKVEYSQTQFGTAPLTSDDIESYVASLTDYFNSADVVFAESSWLTPEVSRAGFTVDLMPLASSDGSLNPADFHPVAWQSFQWDAGMWAIPVAVEPLLIDYNVDAFDAAGLAYPTSAWTLDEFANAARTLTEYDEQGNVVLAGVIIDNASLQVFLRALLGQGFYDTSFPDMPSLNHPELATLLESWQELLDEGVVASSAANFADRFTDVPLRIGGGGNIAIVVQSDDSSDETTTGGGPAFNFNQEQATRSLAPLPNDLNAVSATGFAVSAGSSNPMLAYQLAVYLSQQETVANASFGGEGARLNYASVAPSNTGGGIIILGGTNRSPEQEALVDDTLANGLPASEMRFAQYLRAAISSVASGVDGVTSLRDAEANALDLVTAMDELNVALTVEVDAPVVLAAGEVEISFGYQSFVQPLPNADDWDALIADFVAQDPHVGAIDMEVTGGRFGNNSETEYDCSYYPSSQFIEIDPETLFALDPLIFSDPNYDVNDLATGALAVVQVEGMSYGLPITIQPSMLQYHPDSFAQAGINEPLGGWSISEFGTALQALSNVVAEGEPVFVLAGNNQALLMLIAAQGGLPIDYSTTPPTIKFTDPSTVDAISAVLDWAKAGYIDYQALGDAGGGRIAIALDSSNAAPISATFFAGFGGGGRGGNNNQSPSLTTYPTGARYIPTSFDVGAGYVSKTSAYPEACYRWLSYLASHPYVITGAMPALLSTLNQADVQESLNAATLEAYQSMADLMSAPNMVNFNIRDPFVTTWLNRAFDAYVLEDADLLTELQAAEQPTRDYMECTANLELSVLNFQAIQDCVTTADSGS